MNGYYVQIELERALNKELMDEMLLGELEGLKGNVKFVTISIPVNDPDRTHGEDPEDNTAIIRCPEDMNIAWLQKLLENDIYGKDAEKIYDDIEQEARDMAALCCRKVFKMTEYKVVGMKAGYAYQLILIAFLEKLALNYSKFLKYILETILEQMDTDEDLEKAAEPFMRNKLFGDFQNKRILMYHYVEHYLEEKKLPNVEVLNEISASRYEGSETVARMYFTDQNLEKVMDFGEIGLSNRSIDSKNLRTIRKLMELSSREALYLYTERKGDVAFIKGLGKTKYLNKMEISRDLYIKFYGYLNWSVVDGKREEIRYDHGRYELNVSKKDEIYLAELERLGKGVDHEMLKELIQILRQQKHGTAVVLGDNGIYEETKRLCQLNRGIQLQDGLTREKWDAQQLLSITEIDGALFMDMSGKCLAIGVLVDGRAEKPGDSGKGARFNSIDNYICSQKNGVYVGVIISEDGMINIVANQNAMEKTGR